MKDDIQPDSDVLDDEDFESPSASIPSIRLSPAKRPAECEIQDVSQKKVRLEKASPLPSAVEEEALSLRQSNESRLLKLILIVTSSRDNQELAELLRAKFKWCYGIWWRHMWNQFYSKYKYEKRLHRMNDPDKIITFMPSASTFTVDLRDASAARAASVSEVM